MPRAEPVSWTTEQRARLEPIGVFSRDRSGCFKGIWNQDWLPHDEEKRVDIESFKEKIFEDRAETCFFVEYQDGMTFEAADDLQRLHYENRHLAHGYRDTQRSLKIAIAGIVVSAIFAVLNFALALYQTLFVLPGK